MGCHPGAESFWLRTGTRSRGRFLRSRDRPSAEACRRETSRRLRYSSAVCRRDESADTRARDLLAIPPERTPVSPQSAGVRFSDSAIEVSHENYGRQLLDERAVFRLDVGELLFRYRLFVESFEKVVERPRRTDQVFRVGAGQFGKNSFRV